MIRQYRAKKRFLFLDRTFSASRIIKNPTTAETAIPVRQGRTPTATSMAWLREPSKSMAPMIVGTASRNAYFMVNFLVNPLRNPDDRVMASLEFPGKAPNP